MPALVAADTRPRDQLSRARARAMALPSAFMTAFTVRSTRPEACGCWRNLSAGFALAQAVWLT